MGSRCSEWWGVQWTRGGGHPPGGLEEACDCGLVQVGLLSLVVVPGEPSFEVVRGRFGRPRSGLLFRVKVS